MKRKPLSAVFATLLLVLSLFLVPAMAEESFDASTMRLLNYTGDVQILDLEGVPRFVLENVRFASGETMVTGEDSLASVGLDDSKIVTLDALTKVSFLQEAEHMLLNLLEGQIFIDVSEKLDENASFDIQTTTMTVGIRGTLIFGRVLPAEKPGDPAVTEFGVMEGSGQIDTTDSSGTHRVFNVSAGEIVTATDPGDGQGASFEVRPMTAADTGAFVRDVANSSEQLQQRVIQGSPDGEQFLAPPQGGESSPSVGTGNQYPADGTWTWDQPVQVVAQSASKLYDGEPLRRPDGALVSGLPETCSIAVSCSGSRTDAGTAVNRVDHFVISNSLGQDITGHFTNVQTVDGILRVDPAPLTVWTGSAEKVYDGEPLACDEWEIRTVPGYMAEEPVWRNTSVVSRTALGAETMVGVCGSVWVHGSNPLTGEEKEIELKTGQRLVVSLSDENGKESISFTVETLKVSQLPEDVLRLYADNPELLAQACADVPEWDPEELKTLVAGLDSSADTVNRNGLAVAAEIAGDVMTDSSNLRITMDSGVTNYTTQVLTGTVAHFVPISLDPSIEVVPNGKQEGIGESDNDCEIRWGNADPDNYTVIKDLGKLKIEPLAVQIHCGGGVTATYDGKVFLPWPTLVYLNGTHAGERISSSRVTGSVPGALVTDARLRAASHTYHFQLFTGDTLDLVISGFGTAPGTYTLSGSVTSSSPNLGNISLSFSGATVTIEPAELVISTGSAEKEYDGESLTCEDVTVTGLVGEDTVTVKATGKQTEKGSSPNTYTIDWGDTDPSCYKITENLGTLTVKKPSATPTPGPTEEPTPTPEPTPIPLTISSPSKSKTYDAEPLFLGEEEITVSGLVDGDEIEVYPEDCEISDAGSITPYFSIEWGGTDPDKYSVTQDPGTLTITPRTLTVTTGSASGTYDGSPVVNTDAPDIIGLVGDDLEYVSAENTGSQTDVGESDNTCVLDWGIANPDNYTVTYRYGKLTVTPLEVIVFIFGNYDTVKYDGTEHTVSGYSDVSISSYLYTTSDFSYKNGGTPSVKGTDAGSYYLELADRDFTNNNPNFDVYFDAKMPCVLTVEPRDVTLTSGSGSKKYDGSALTAQTVTVGGDGFAGSDGASYSFTGSQTDAGSSENAFSYTLSGSTSAENYNISTEYGTLEVTQRNVTLTSGSGSKKYDGSALTAQTVTVGGDGFVSGEGATYSFTGSQTHAGSSENTFSYTLSSGTKAANYSISTTNGSLEVTQRNVTLRSKGDSKTYDGTPLTNGEVVVEGDGFASGEGATYNVTGTITNYYDNASGNNTFTYTLNANTAAGDYNITTQYGTLRINSFELRFKADPSQLTVTYDGSSYGFSGEFDHRIDYYIQTEDGTIIHPSVSGRTLTYTLPTGDKYIVNLASGCGGTERGQYPAEWDSVSTNPGDHRNYYPIDACPVLTIQ